MAGELMLAEMAEQPVVLGRMLERRPSILERLRTVVPDQPSGILLVARGSSDHAALYGRYILEHATARPVSMAAPSLITRYGVPLKVSDWLVVAISQSGQTPEIIEVAERLAARDAVVLAVTNDEESPLVDVAHHVVALEAGVEHAVPATKTFTAELMAMALVAEAIGHLPWSANCWERLPDAVDEVLDDHAAVDRATELLVADSGLVVAGRGFLLAAALETALKIKECAGLLAQGYSTADLRHGPIAVVERGFPALVLSARGPTERDATELVEDLRQRGAAVVEVGQRDVSDIVLPFWLPEGLAAFASAVRGQQIAFALSLRRGRDPDDPEGLSKITRTH